MIVQRGFPAAALLREPPASRRERAAHRRCHHQRLRRHVFLCGPRGAARTAGRSWPMCGPCRPRAASRLPTCRTRGTSCNDLCRVSLKLAPAARSPPDRPRRSGAAAAGRLRGAATGAARLADRLRVGGRHRARRLRVADDPPAHRRAMGRTGPARPGARGVHAAACGVVLGAALDRLPPGLSLGCRPRGAGPGCRRRCS